MLWALLFSLIFSSPESGMVNAKFNKHVKKFVDDKERKDQILILVKEFEKEAKVLRKKEKKELKELNELNSSSNTTTEQFKTFFSDLMKGKKIVDELRIKNRLKIQQLIEKDEWKKIVIASKEYWDKNEKKRLRKISQIEKSFLKVEKKIQQNIIEEERKQKALNIVRHFEEEVIRIEKAIDDINGSNSSAMSKLNATEEELHVIQDQLNELRWQLFDSYANNHREMANITNDEEWLKISKSLNKVF